MQLYLLKIKIKQFLTRKATSRASNRHWWTFSRIFFPFNSFRDLLNLNTKSTLKAQKWSKLWTIEQSARENVNKQPRWTFSEHQKKISELIMTPSESFSTRLTFFHTRAHPQVQISIYIIFRYLWIKIKYFRMITGRGRVRLLRFGHQQISMTPKATRHS